MSLSNVYNELYGTAVATNGNLIAVGNPPSTNWNYSEGLGKVGQVSIVKKNNYKQNYSINKTLSSSYAYESNSDVFYSNFGESVDICDYFLAVGDTEFTRSLYGTSGTAGTSGTLVKKSLVSVFEINPNYYYNTSSVNHIQPSKNPTCNIENTNTYEITNTPIFTVTSSLAGSDFGKSVGISNNFLVIGQPKASNNRGKVYVYKYNDEIFTYKLQTTLTSSTVLDPYQTNFGYCVSIDKYNEDKILVGCNQPSGSKVFLFKSGSKGWKISQRFEQITGSDYIKLEGQSWDLIPSSSLSASQLNDRFGSSVSIHKNTVVIGAPNALKYYEYTGSKILRQRGAAYIYSDLICLTGSNQFELVSKTFGDDLLFKDNWFGYSVSTYNNKVLIGSPKPNFPFGTLYISGSINRFDKNLNENNFGESTYCGQACLYDVSQYNITQLTTDPISKRKEYSKPFNAYGSAVAISDSNLIIGAPLPTLNDLGINTVLITESGSAADANYVLTSSYNPEDCDLASNVVYYQIEDTVYSQNPNKATIVIRSEDEYAEKIEGKCFIYDFADLQNNYIVGNIFYNNNRIVINNTGSIFNNLTRDPVNNNFPYIYMEYQSQVTLHEKQYICKIEPGEFNVSVNPSAVTSSLIDYGIFNKINFDFNNLDIVLRFINYKITSPSSEQWWKTFITSDVESSMFMYYTSSVNGFTNNRLTDELKCTLANKDFDVNKDGTVNIQDGYLIWKYFTKQLTYNNYKNYIDPLSKRNNYDDIVNFLNDKTGKFNLPTIKKDFFDYQYSSSYDPTGSYLAPYITQVGLYANADLVAVAKLAQPIKNAGEIPINIIVKWDT